MRQQDVYDVRPPVPARGATGTGEKREKSLEELAEELKAAKAAARAQEEARRRLPGLEREREEIRAEVRRLESERALRASAETASAARLAEAVDAAPDERRTRERMAIRFLERREETDERLTFARRRLASIEADIAKATRTVKGRTEEEDYYYE